MASKKTPIIQRKRMHKVGGSIMVPIPLDWFENNGFGDKPDKIIESIKNHEFLVICDGDVRIINPSNEDAVLKRIYGFVTKEVRKDTAESR